MEVAVQQPIAGRERLEPREGMRPHLVRHEQRAEPVPQFVVQTSPVFPQLVALGAVFAVLALVMDGTVALVASRAREWFASSPRRMERVGGAGGLMMVGLGTGLLLTGRTD